MPPMILKRFQCQVGSFTKRVHTFYPVCGDVLRSPHHHAALVSLSDAQLKAEDFVGAKATLLEIEENLESVASDPMAIEALELVVDGVPSNEIEAVLQSEIDAMSERHMAGANIMRKAADVSGDGDR